MKKPVYFLLSVALSAMFASCGPSAEEKMAEEKRIADSVAAATAAAIQDSLQKVQEAEMALQKAMEDSLRMKALEDSLAAIQEKQKKAAAPKAPKKTQEQKNQEKQIKEVKDATRGRG